MESNRHISVFRREVIANLQVRADGCYLDLTLGAGGHSMELLRQLDGGRLIVVDVDGQAISNFAKQLSDWKREELSPQVAIYQQHQTQVVSIHDNFANVDRFLRQYDWQVDGVIADLGWSSEQLERVSGLSYQVEAPLDMRMDERLQVQAKDLLNALGKNELKQLFGDYADIYGKVMNSLVEHILQFRTKRMIQTTTDLLEIISKTEMATASHRGSLPARVFQALRIAVNTELSTLQSMMPRVFVHIRAGGTFQVITFHSGEEKLVKRQFEVWVAAANAEYLHADGVQRPSIAELQSNLRARSAKLFAIKKLK